MHVVQELHRRKKLKKDFPVFRVVFHQITKNAILQAIKNPRQIDMNLVDAYLARRALDYLVGFNISPILWRKLPGAKSAGRVQSVALRLVSEREDEINSFVPKEYWTVDVDLNTERKEKFTAKLTQADGKKLDKFDLANSTIAGDIKNGWKMLSSSSARLKRNKSNATLPLLLRRRRCNKKPPASSGLVRKKQCKRHKVCMRELI